MYTDNAVFPNDSSILSSEAIRLNLERVYGEPIRICRLFYRSIHDTYIAHTDHDNYFFKVYRFGLRTKQEIQSEVNCILHLLHSNIPVTIPVTKQDGDYICEFDTDKGKRYGVLFTAVGDKQVADVKENDKLNVNLGEYLASIHKAWDSYQPEVNNRWLDIKQIVDDSMQHIEYFSQFYSFDLYFLQDLAALLKEKMQNLSKDTIAYGMCHGDFYSGNIRLDASNQPFLFDFDFSGTGWRMYDIALYANAFGLGCTKESIIKREKRKDAFLKGYNSIQPLTDEMVQSMNLFVPYRRIFNIGTIYSAMSNTFGDHFAIHNTNQDIKQLKRWMQLNDI